MGANTYEILRDWNDIYSRLSRLDAATVYGIKCIVELDLKFKLESYAKASIASGVSSSNDIVRYSRRSKASRGKPYRNKQHRSNECHK